MHSRNGIRANRSHLVSGRIVVMLNNRIVSNGLPCYISATNGRGESCKFAFYSPIMSGMASSSLMLSRPISPWLEMGAYECLWTNAHQTFKRIADLFRDKEDALPSDFILRPFAEECAKEATDLLNQAHVKRFGIRVSGTGDYPDKLRDAKNPVELLYFQGWWDLLNTPCVAVVGTRKPSDAGLARTEKLVRNLVGDGYTIMSGLAAGIDTMAHQTAIASSGQTIAVIGTPLSKVYPLENTELQKQIARDYLLISQVPVIRYTQQDWRSNRSFFPQRNVTMSALSAATIIVEAGETSGTLMQAAAAIQQKRKLFILDSCFHDYSLTWPRKYQGLGAVRVKDYEDIRKHLVDSTTENR
jgi:DNA processing protein